jgi:hypothetical protein
MGTKISIAPGKDSPSRERFDHSLVAFEEETFVLGACAIILEVLELSNFKDALLHETRKSSQWQEVVPMVALKREDDWC